eukprot:CAMPEP_0179158440 /NCGR_PEP_ID=MMETSP0796-20121207/77311_1 /TAXON_ID=73915 /ORGANISM="Pyrodinium bahamense, Strain pbaha01" /LENGTH=298 /DNA_ID=CAMNT_0020860111 /DNA_START=42 /DNA_END=934 /DNA_ORIENTATION=+
MTDAILAQVQELDTAIKQLQSKRAALQTDVDSLSKEHAEKQAEVEEMEGRLAALHLVLPPPEPKDEVIALDVGGRAFKAYQSTLMQFEGSVLATLASSHWANGPAGRNGKRNFWDMDPDAFREILAFLRRRRLTRDAKAVFSTQAAHLAEYLGVPVDSVKVETYVSVKSIDDGDKTFKGFMFDLSMPGQWECCLRTISFRSSGSTQVTIYVKSGSFLGDPQVDAGQWSEVCCEPVVAGEHRVLDYSSKPSKCTHTFLSKTGLQCGDSMLPACEKGRAAGETVPFTAGSHNDDRYFIGT